LLGGKSHFHPIPLNEGASKEVIMEREEEVELCEDSYDRFLKNADN